MSQEASSSLAPQTSTNQATYEQFLNYGNADPSTLCNQGIST